MLSGVDAALLMFCEPWLAREPRLLLACQFAPLGIDRGRFLATQVLVRELAQTAIAVSDRRVAQAKLAWWIEETAFWAQGHPRHPLAHGLDARQSAPSLAQLLACATAWLSAAQPDSVATVMTQLQALAKPTANLAGARLDGWIAVWLAVSIRASLHAQTPLAGVVPMDLLARHGVRRSAWLQLDAGLRLPLLQGLASSLPQVDGDVAGAALAASVKLERRWLKQIRLDDRVGVIDVLSAWRAARRARSD